MVGDRNGARLHGGCHIPVRVAACKMVLSLKAYKQAKKTEQFRTCWEGCVAEQRRSAGAQAASEGRLTVREACVQERTHHTSALPQHFSLATRFRDPSLPKVETQAQLKVSLPSLVYSLACVRSCTVYLVLMLCGCITSLGNVQQVQPRAATGPPDVPAHRRRGGQRRCGG
jgi:hypothetical protein